MRASSPNRDSVEFNIGTVFAPSAKNAPLDPLRMAARLGVLLAIAAGFGLAAQALVGVAP